MVLITLTSCWTAVASRCLAIPRATGLDLQLWTTFALAWTATTKRSLAQSCRLFVLRLFKRLLTSATPTGGAMVQPSSLPMVTLLANTRQRSKLARLESTCPSLSLSPCSHSLAARTACGAPLTSTARALFSSTQHGRLSPLAGRSLLLRPSASRLTSPP